MSDVEVGVDEAGVGPGFGSLWAAAVHLPVPVEGIQDSKRLTKTRRTFLREAILQVADYGLGEVTAQEIDAWGLGEARRVVFERALDDYMLRGGPAPAKVIVDGTLFRKWRNVPFECIPRADSFFSHVGAASILAKTTRDAQVVEWCDDHPDLAKRYDLRRNMGYLTEAHRRAIAAHGKLPEVHRWSYKIKEIERGGKILDI